MVTDLIGYTPHELLGAVIAWVWVWLSGCVAEQRHARVSMVDGRAVQMQ